MKVLCIHGACGPFYVRSGLGNALQYASHTFSWWNRHTSSAFDAFDKANPDLFIGTTWELDTATIKCIKERPHMKVVMVASDWGDFSEKVDVKKYPVLMANKNEVKTVENLFAETEKPNLVWCHYSDDWIKVTHNYWSDKIGLQVKGVINAADIIEYFPGDFREELASDISFVGGYWGYKSRTLDNTIVRLCHPVGERNIKIWGNQQWPVPQYLGVVDTPTVRSIVASAKICLNVSEEHSNVYGYDLVERPFKVGAMGGFCLSDKADWGPVLPSLPLYSNFTELKSLVAHYLEHDEERREIASRLQAEVLEAHTYFDRLATIFDAIGLDSSGIIEAKARCIQEKFREAN